MLIGAFMLFVTGKVNYSIRYTGLLNRKLIYLSVAFLFANMGWGMAWPYLPNLIKLLGGSILYVALLSTLFNLTSSFGQYFWGRRSDASGKRKPYALLGLFSSGFFFILIGISGSAISVLILRTFQGFFVSSQTPAISALVSELSTNVGRGFGTFNMFSNIGFMLGNFIGGFVVSHYGTRHVFLASSVPFFIALIMILFFKEEARKIEDLRPLYRYDRPGRTVFSWTKSAEFIKRNRNIVIFTISIFILMLSSGMVYSYLSLLLEARFGKDFVGYYYGIDGLFASFFIYPFGYLADRYGSKAVTLFGLVAYALTYLLYYISTTPFMIILTAAISGAKWASYFNSINAYVSRMSTREERATALGVLNSGISMGWVIGPLIGSITVVMYGIPEMILLAIAPVIVSLTVLIFVENDIHYIDGRKVN